MDGMGNESARAILIKQARDQADKLENGSATDPKANSRGVALALRMIATGFEENLVSRNVLEKRLLEFRAECPAHAEAIRRAAAWKASPFSWIITLLGPILRDLAIILGVIFLILGKYHKWW